MRIAIPIDEDRKTICPVLGRTPFFGFFDSESGEMKLEENPAASASEGAGLKAAQFIVDMKADVLITPRAGSNSAEVLKEAEISIYKSEGTDPDENVKAFCENRLSVLEKFHSGYHGVR